MALCMDTIDNIKLEGKKEKKMDTIDNIKMYLRTKMMMSEKFLLFALTAEEKTMINTVLKIIADGEAEREQEISAELKIIEDANKLEDEGETQ